MLDFITQAVASLDFPLFTSIATFLDSYTYPILFLLWLFLLLKSKGKKEKQRALVLLVSAVILVLAVPSLKFVFNEERPCVQIDGKIECPTDASFPSGHAAASALFLPALLQFPIFFLYFLFYILVVFSRMYLGVHTLGDVAAGTAIGISLYLIVGRLLVERFAKNLVKKICEKRRLVRRYVKK